MNFHFSCVSYIGDIIFIAIKWDMEKEEGKEIEGIFLFQSESIRNDVFV
jgi:hypothetical protein